MRNSREFAVLTLLNDAADTFDKNDQPDAIEALLERQLKGLEKLAARQRRMRSNQFDAAPLRLVRKLS